MDLSGCQPGGLRDPIVGNSTRVRFVGQWLLWLISLFVLSHHLLFPWLDTRCCFSSIVLVFKFLYFSLLLNGIQLFFDLVDELPRLRSQYLSRRRCFRLGTTRRRSGVEDRRWPSNSMLPSRLCLLLLDPTDKAEVVDTEKVSRRRFSILTAWWTWKVF